MQGTRSVSHTEIFGFWMMRLRSICHIYQLVMFGILAQIVGMSAGPSAVAPMFWLHLSSLANQTLWIISHKIISYLSNQVACQQTGRSNQYWCQFGAPNPFSLRACKRGNLLAMLTSSATPNTVLIILSTPSRNLAKFEWCPSYFNEVQINPFWWI